MDGKSKDIKQEKIKNLKKLFPEVFAEGKVDVEKLKLSLGEDVNINEERYVLNWAGKSDAFTTIQTPTTATLTPAKEESVDFDKTDNIFIEGENLEVLKVLQKSYYNKVKMIYIDPPYNTGNDSFIYPDRFQESKEEYLKRIGEKDEEGYLTKEGFFKKNSKENGQFHSNWLSMMYPRLFLARNLLRDDGVIFVSIGQEELNNLISLCDEIFSEENRISVCTRVMKTGGNKGRFFSPNTEYILVYARNIENVPEFREDLSQDLINKVYTQIETTGLKKGEKYRLMGLFQPGLDERANQRYWIKAPDSSFVIPPGKKYPKQIADGIKVDPDKGDGVWRWTYKTYKNELTNNNIIFKTTSSSPLIDDKGKQSKWNIYTKIWLNDRLKEGRIPVDFIDKFENRHSSQEMKELEIPFEFAKPVGLIRHLINISGVKNHDLVMDFFAGSGTTAHSILNLDKEDEGTRKFICVQMPEKCDEDSEAYKAGYKTIAEIGKERIRRVIKQIKEVIASETKQSHLFKKEKNNLDLGFKVFKLQPSNFKIWRSDAISNEEELDKQLDAFKNPVKPKSEKENMLYELLLKTGYDLNTKIEEKKFGGCSVYSIASGEVIIALSKIDEKAVSEILKLNPQKFICLDSLFEGDDQLKTNTALQMKDAGIEFKTI